MQESDFKAPRGKSDAFKKYWDRYIDSVRERENLRQVHLHQYQILCDLFVEYDELTESINENGTTYESVGRNGTQIKAHPDVQQKNRVVGEIRNYSKMLGLILVKDTKFGEDGDNDFE